MHDEIDLPFLDLETLHVLSSDIDDKMHVMIEVMCCFEVCHCFDDVEVNFQAVLSISAPYSAMLFKPSASTISVPVYFFKM